MTRHDGGTPGTQQWRPVLATLANAEQRLLLAEVIIAEGEREGTVVSAARREQGLARLAASGLLTGEDGEWKVDAAGLRGLLTAPVAERQEPSGDDVLDRFVSHGRIHTYPTKPGPRRRLLDWAAPQALSADEVLTEGQLNQRLDSLSGDVVTLRRYLVDAGLLTRSTDGSAYRLAAPKDDTPRDAVRQD